MYTTLKQTKAHQIILSHPPIYKQTAYQPCQKNLSKKKYLQVYSKTNDSHLKSNNHTSNHHLFHSQQHIFDTRYNRSVSHRQTINVNQKYNGRTQHLFHYHPSHPHQRSYSMPTKTIVVQQIIRPLPINISYLQPNNVSLHPQQYHLEKKITNLQQNNHKIFGTERMSERDKDNNDFHRPLVNVVNIQPNDANNKISTPLQIKHQQKIPTSTTTPKSFKVNFTRSENDSTISNPNNLQGKIITQHIPLLPKPNKTLTNQQYLKCSINLIHPKKVQQSTNTHFKNFNEFSQPNQNIRLQHPSSQKNKKQFLKTEGMTQCCCSRLANFNECIEIKIHTKRSLLPNQYIIKR